MPAKTRRMPRKSQVAFAKAWLEKQNIESQTVDVDSLIDGTLSYEENLKIIKRHIGVGGRSKKKATRTMSATECDVSIGNYAAGMNGRETKRACACGDPDACDDLEKRKKPKPKPKAKPKAKKTATKKRTTTQKTVRGRTVPQKKKPKAKAKRKIACKRVTVKSHTRKCPRGR